MAATTSASSSSSYGCHYHVFLSFRGEDTRKGFSDHLYRALELAGIHTFRDDDEIERGANIAAEAQSYTLVTDHASSRWCLDELAKIVERKKKDGHMVIPVFYKVDPSHVRKQTHSLAHAFAKHEQLFEKAIGGMVIGDQFESQLIQNVVEEIVKKLNPMTLNVAPYAVGVDDRVEAINLWLRDGSNDVGLAGIYWMGGIGKTTIAKAAYNLNLDSFEASRFLADMRVTSEQPNGMIHLQRKLLSDIQKGKSKKI